MICFITGPRNGEQATSSDADERLLVSDGIITGDIVLQGLLKGRK